MNEFLVKCIENKTNHWIDINSGQQFERCNVPYNLCEHGLCATLNKKVLKKTIPDNFEPLVLMSIEKTSPKFPKKDISFSYMNEDGMKSTWTFTPYEIMEAIEGLNEDMNDRELAVMLFAPRDVVKKLRYKLTGGLIEKIMKELGGEKDGNKHRRDGKLRITTSKRVNHIKPISNVSKSKQNSYQGKL